MKITGLKGLCFGSVLMIMLGLSPAVIAEDNVAKAAPEAFVTETLTESITATKPLMTPRLSAPTTDNPYFYADNAYYQGGYGLPNCTAYAYGRAYEILGTKPNLPMNDAGNWWNDNLQSGAYTYGSTPKLGAIICWNGSYYGHVAVVEAINGDQVTVSESAYSGPLFNTYSYTIGMENVTSVGGFQGYIYIGDFIDATTDTQAPLLENVRIAEVDDDGFTITANVSDLESGIEKVQIPVWTKAGGQDDVVWYDAVVAGDRASCRVELSEHHYEQGDYRIHVYATDKTGNKTIVKTHTLINTGADELIAETVSPGVNLLPFIG